MISCHFVLLYIRISHGDSCEDNADSGVKFEYAYFAEIFCSVFRN